MCCSVGADHTKAEFVLAGSGACQYLPLDVTHIDLIWPLVERSNLVWGFLGKDSSAGQCEMLPVTGPKQPDWSYKAIHSLWLPFLELGMHAKGQAVCQRWLPPVPSLGAGQQKAQGTLRFASTCFYLPAVC